MVFSRDDLLLLYRNMVRARKLDERVIEIFYRDRPARGFTPHSGIGEEAVGVGACTFLRADDWVAKSHRGFAVDAARGTPLDRMMAGSFARSTGLCKGKGGGHACYLERRVVGWGGTIGSCFPIAVGLGFAAKRKGTGEVVVCFFGDGAAQRGTLHESMNWASVQKLPIVWVCENNQYFVGMPVTKAIAAKNIADLACAYNMPGEVVDGQDVLAVCESTQAAAERARRGEGPALIECKTYRFRAHEEDRGAPGYAGKEDPRPRDELQHWLARDPIKLMGEYLLAHGFRADEMDAIDREAEQEAAAAEAFALASPYPEPGEAYQDLYAD